MYLTIFLPLYGDFILTLNNAFSQQVMEKVVDPSVVSMEFFLHCIFSRHRIKHNVDTGCN